MRHIKVARITARGCFDKERYGEAWEKVKKATPLSVRRCEKCGSKKGLERDHIIPISKGGSNTISNMRILCEDCHDVIHPHRKKRRKNK